jgi:hypothetical protein
MHHHITLPNKHNKNKNDERSAKMDENEVLDRFIKSGVLKGIWFKEVPVGLEVLTKIALRERKSWEEFEPDKVINIYSVGTKSIDAVCITDFQNLIKPSIKLGDWIKIYMDVSLNPFKGRSVWLIEAKSALMSESAFTAIGQLLYYEHHFKKDWKGIIQGKAIVYGCETDEVTLDAIKGLKTPLGIVAWHVSRDGKVTCVS